MKYSQSGYGGDSVILDINPPSIYLKNDLAEGENLRAAISEYKNEQTAEKLLGVLEILRHSRVWIPCRAMPGEAMQKQIEKIINGSGFNAKSVKGKTFTAADTVKLEPIILQGGDYYFFPVFSSREEMDSSEDCFSAVEQDFLDVIPVARANKYGIKGIVVDPFSEPMIIAAELFELIEKPDNKQKGFFR